MARILAVDWGERRIGLAVSDPTGTIATGLPTLEPKRMADAPALVAALAREREVESIVVGLPLLLSGERGSAAKAAEGFAAKLRQASGLPVSLMDERLTSAISERRMLETGTRQGRGKGRIDQGAAIVLLEGWLAKLAGEARRREDLP